MNNYSPNSYPQPTTKRRVDSSGPDFYPTPRWATQALVDHEFFEGTVWEPACGDGAMARVLEENGLAVFSSDLHDRGFGEFPIDFLSKREFSPKKVDNIITNPPYNLAEKFVLCALEKSEKKVALLLRLAFLESSRRQKNIFQKFPPTRVWVFSERVTFYPKGEERESGGTTAYAWFVWDHAYTSMVPFGMLDETQLKWISLGRKPNSRRAHKPLPDKTLTLSDLR